MLSGTSRLSLVHVWIVILWSWMDAYLCMIHSFQGHRSWMKRYLQESTRGILRFKLTTSIYFTVKMSVYYLVTSFNRQPGSQTATVIASYWTSCVILLYSSRSTHKSSTVTESYLSKLKQFSNFSKLASSQLGNILMYWISMIQLHQNDINYLRSISYC
jgi:hypothetical protein